MYDIKQSTTAQPLIFFMTDSADHLTGKTGLSPTVTIRKVGGSFASPSGSVTEIANGWYQVAGNATDSNTLGPLILHATGTGADPTDMFFVIVAYDPQDSVRQGLTGLANAVPGAAGGLFIAGTNAATTITTSFTTTFTGSLTGNVNGSVGSVPVTVATAAALATAQTDITTIKGKTNSLTFTQAGNVDANIQLINDVPVTGNGQSATKFGVT